MTDKPLSEREVVDIMERRFKNLLGTMEVHHVAKRVRLIDVAHWSALLIFGALMWCLLVGGCIYWADKIFEWLT